LRFALTHDVYIYRVPNAPRANRICPNAEHARHGGAGTVWMASLSLWISLSSLLRSSSFKSLSISLSPSVPSLPHSPTSPFSRCLEPGREEAVEEASYRIFPTYIGTKFCRNGQQAGTTEMSRRRSQKFVTRACRDKGMTGLSVLIYVCPSPLARSLFHLSSCSPTSQAIQTFHGLDSSSFYPPFVPFPLHLLTGDTTPGACGSLRMRTYLPKQA
jgi:hypothetical protein